MQVNSTPVTETGTTAPSDPVIPAVRGEFYSYSSVFSVERPLGFLMKCKANKARPMTDAEDYVHELDLTFLFGNVVRICSPNVRPSVRLLEDVVSADEFNQTSIVFAGITEDEFNQIRQKKIGATIAQVCRATVWNDDEVLTLTPGAILAVTTESGKFGLILIKEVTPTSVRVDACHILL